MKDPIERQAAIDELKRISFSHCFECSEYLSEDIREIEIINSNKALEAIEALPSAQPEPQWIPCSEMEPKKSGRYLCTHSGTGIVSPDYYTTHEQAEELFADPEDEYLDLEEYIGWTSKNVIAWMPLPEPYREERRTDEQSD